MMPIGIFDSGFGGLTVFKELQHTLPHEQMLYLGDTAHLPYGTKSRETIIRYTAQNCSFLIDQGVKLIVIACNTATAMALETVQLQFSIPIVGVIDPVIEQVAQASPRKRIGILGTRATVLSGAYQRKIHHLLPDAEITAIASPLLVSLVEEGFIDHALTQLAIQEYVRPLLLAQVDTVVLACTHFPLLKEFIEQALEPAVQVIDPAFACVKAVEKTLHQLNLLTKDQGHSEPLFYVTDDPDKFARLSPYFLGHEVSQVQKISLNDCSIKTF